MNGTKQLQDHKAQSGCLVPKACPATKVFRVPMVRMVNQGLLVWRGPWAQLVLSASLEWMDFVVSLVFLVSFELPSMINFP